MRWSRFGWLVAAAALGAGATTIAGACSSFSAADEPDAAPDVDAADAASPACELPTTPPKTPDDSVEAGAPIFADLTFLDVAVAPDGTLYGRTTSTTIVSGKGTDPSEPTTFATSSLEGSSVGMHADDHFVMIGTDKEVTSINRAASGSATTWRPSTADSSYDHLLFGTASFYAWKSDHLVRQGMDSATTPPTQISIAVTAVAVDADEAYFTVKAPTGTQAPIGSFSNQEPQAYVSDPVQALAVSGGVAFAASLSGTNSLISRVALGKGSQADPLLIEFGLIQHLVVDRGRLYWVANRGAGLVLASSDLCGKDYRLLATQLPNPLVDLAFDETNAYATGGSTLQKISKTKN